MTKGFALYGYWRSSAAYRVRIALNLKGLHYENRPVHLVKGGGEQHASAYAAMNPQQLVPSEDKQNVVVRGRLRTLVNGFETTNDLKAYLVEFSFSGGRMHLKTFKEVPNAS